MAFAITLGIGLYLLHPTQSLAAEQTLLKPATSPDEVALLIVIKNEADYAISNVKIRVFFKDRPGTTIDYQEALGSYVLLPGRSVCYYALSEKADLTSRYEILIDSADRAADMYVYGLEATTHGTGRNEAGIFIITGEILNNSPYPASLVRIDGILYDSAGNLVDCAVGFLDPDPAMTLPYGSTSHFIAYSSKDIDSAEFSRVEWTVWGYRQS